MNLHEFFQGISKQKCPDKVVLVSFSRPDYYMILLSDYILIFTQQKEHFPDFHEAMQDKDKKSEQTLLAEEYAAKIDSLEGRPEVELYVEMKPPPVAAGVKRHHPRSGGGPPGVFPLEIYSGMTF